MAGILANGFTVKSVQITIDVKEGEVSSGVPIAVVSFSAGVVSLLLTFAVYRELPTVIQSVGMVFVLASILCYTEAK